MGISDFATWRKEVRDVLNLEKKGSSSNCKEISDIKHFYRNEDTEYNKNQRMEIPIFEIENYSTLVENIGELMHYFSEKNIEIYFRGQKKLYFCLQEPTLIRDYYKLDRIREDHKEPNFFSTYTKYLQFVLGNLQKFNKDLTELGLNNLQTLEPLLQHYGFKTRWIDLVNNMHIAIWFSTYSLEEQKFEAKDGSSFFIVYAFQKLRRIAKGIWEGENQRLVDLRQATPGGFLRPHAQHGFSLTDKRLLDLTFEQIGVDNDVIKHSDFSKFVLCVFKYPKKTAIKWLKGTNAQSIPEIFAESSQFPNKHEKFFQKFYYKLLELILELYKEYTGSFDVEEKPSIKFFLDTRVFLIIDFKLLSSSIEHFESTMITSDLSETDNEILSLIDEIKSVI